MSAVQRNRRGWALAALPVAAAVAATLGCSRDAPPAPESTPAASGDLSAQVHDF